MHTTPNGVLNNTVGANHTNNGVISPPLCCLTHHLVWYAHFIFYSAQIVLLDDGLIDNLDHLKDNRCVSVQTVSPQSAKKIVTQRTHDLLCTYVAIAICMHECATEREYTM